MKNCYTELPVGYTEVYRLNLQKDKKKAILVNGIAMVMIVALFFLGNAIVPLSTLFDMTDGEGVYFIRLGILIGGYVIYIILHEAVHGIAMKCYGAPKLKFGFTGLYAFAGSEAYFSKVPYIVIALAPVVVWGLVLLVLNLIVPASWFWVIYFIQVGNLSGAAGDLYVTCKFIGMPKDILVQDAGVSMAVYSGSAEQKREHAPDGQGDI